MHHELTKFPPAFVQRLKELVPPGLMTEVARGFMASRPTTIRVNTLKATPDQVIKVLSRFGVSCEPIKGWENAFVMKEGSLKKLTSSQPYEEGWIYLQNPSSQIPPVVLAPLPGEKVLDLAAAPGGKTCQIASLMKNEGEITAVEPDDIRFERLVFNLNRQGAKIAIPFKMSGLKMREHEPEVFDRVLLDAPCSSEGTFSLKEPKSYSHWSEEFVKKQSTLQKKLIRVALACLKPGGRMVYSTCALSPEENEEVIQYALECQEGLEVLPIPLKYPFLKPGISEWRGVSFSPQISQTRRIFPSERMEGFFIAHLQKAPR